MKQRKVLGVIFLLFLLLGCRSQEEINSAENRLIVCLGDSLTFGKGAEEGKNFPAYLEQFSRFRVVNAGVSGDTTSGALLRINRDVLRLHPDLVIIELGGNDYLRGVPFSLTLANITRMIDILRKNNIKVVLCDVFDYPFMRRYRIAFARLCRKSNCLFIPHVLAGIIDKGALMSDSIHPNSQGYKIMAERIYKAIKKILNE